MFTLCLDRSQSAPRTRARVAQAAASARAWGRELYARLCDSELAALGFFLALILFTFLI